MKKLLLAILLVISIFVMAHVDRQIIQRSPYPSLSQVQTK